MRAEVDDVGITIIRGGHRKPRDATYYARRAAWARGFVLGGALMTIVGMIVIVLAVNHG